MLNKVVVILLNWNGYSDTIECLESLRLQVFNGDLSVVVIDNKSIDNSIDQIRLWVNSKSIDYNEIEFDPNTVGNKVQPGLESSAWLNLVRCTQNVGFCLGNNFGLEFAKANSAHYGFILNNDTLLDSMAVTNLVNAAERSGSQSIISPAILYANRRELIWWAGGRFNMFLSPEYSHLGMPYAKLVKGIRATDWVSGCATLVPIPLYNRIGGYDPNYFIWCEEWDFSLRARAVGIGIYVCTEAVVYHKVGQSLGLVSPLTFYYSFRNMLSFRFRHMGKSTNLIYSMIFVPYKFVQSITLSIRLRNRMYFLAAVDILLQRNIGSFGRWLRQVG